MARSERDAILDLSWLFVLVKAYEDLFEDELLEEGSEMAGGEVASLPWLYLSNEAGKSGNGGVTNGSKESFVQLARGAAAAGRRFGTVEDGGLPAADRVRRLSGGVSNEDVSDVERRSIKGY